jgi:hypothetical protein
MLEDDKECSFLIAIKVIPFLNQFFFGGGGEFIVHIDAPRKEC